MIDESALWPLIEARARATPHALLAVDERGRELCFGAYRERSLAVAAGLAEWGIGAGSTVAWQLPTRIEALVLVGALSRLGAIQNPLLPIYREREVSFIVGECRPGHLLVPGRWRGFDYEALARGVAWAHPGLDVRNLDAGLPLADPGALPLAAGDPDAVRWIFYTSGTTAEPKGALHSDFTVGAAARAMCERFSIGARDRGALVFPFTHIGGIEWLFAAMHVGVRLLLTERFEPEVTIPWLAEQGVTLAGAGTPFHIAYLEAQRRRPDVRLFPDVRVFTGGGAPKPAELHYELKAELGGEGILAGWGLTEFPNIAMCSIGDPDRLLAETEGRPTPGVELRVVRADGLDAEPLEEGELRARGPHCCLGFADPRLAADAFDERGFLRTGDLVWRTPEGHVVISGRRKDVIIRNGENISAKEVEDLLYLHPDVLDVAVVGLPDPRVGERACAVVVPRDPQAPPDLEGLTSHLRARGLMLQKLPERLEVSAALPRNAAGKVQKQELRKRYAAGGRSPA